MTEFKMVTYDGDLDDFSESELRELVREFEDAQSDNKTEFSELAEALSADTEEFQAAREELIDDITDAAAFEEIPIDRDGLEEEDFSALREWHEYVGGEKAESSTDGDPDDFGKKSPAPEDNGGEFSEIVDENVESIPGVTLE